jgi:hypothetical protein
LTSDAEEFSFASMANHNSKDEPEPNESFRESMPIGKIVFIAFIVLAAIVGAILLFVPFNPIL